jgi:hypothetical protein
MGRKGLNDSIHGDRSSIRGFRAAKEPTWDDFEAGALFKGSQTWGAATTTSKGAKSGGSLYSFSSVPSCHESHPPLKLPGTELVIYGGSCLHPKVKDADVYIGFDGGMRRSERQYPWVEGDEVKYEITDMSTPKTPAMFDKLVDWTKQQLEAGRKVHCGCIGGHGRTGMFLAALVSKFGEKDAIAYVRRHYCKRAVESSTQVKFLVDRYKVAPAQGTKSGSAVESPKTGGAPAAQSAKKGDKGVKGKATQTFNPVVGQGCIW